jgi:Undecaprenyl-phosphate galactose phosphotransferase WbaP
MVLISPPDTKPLSTTEVASLLWPVPTVPVEYEGAGDRLWRRAPSWQEHWACLRQVWITSAPLLVADALSASGAFALAYRAVAAAGLTGLPQLTLGLAGLLLLSILAHWSMGLYPGTGLSATDELRAVSYAVIMGHSGLLMAACVYSAASAWVIGGSGLLALAMTPLARQAARNISARFPAWGERVVMFGHRGDAQAIYQALLAHPQQGLRPVGIVDMPQDDSPADELGFDDYRCHLDEAEHLIRRRRVTWGIVPIERWEGEPTMRHLDQLAGLVPHLILVLPKWGPAARQAEGAHRIGDFPTFRVDERLLLPLLAAVKRAMDLTLLALGSVLVLPIMALLMILVRLSSPGPVFYSQERLGMRGRTFKAWKFRSMVRNADEVLERYLTEYPKLSAEWQCTHKLKCDPRVTRIGRFLRKTSLDELPQLWNVLCGEMSLVGPRPIVQAEVVKYSHCYSLYTRVRPGITGLWQVSGRNNTSYETRVSLDMKYVRTWSPWLDICLLARTVKVVLKCEGAY